MSGGGPAHPPIEAEALRPRWRALAEAGLGASPALSVETFAALIAAYGAPGRAYHTLGHVAAMLARMAGWRWRLSDWRGAELAVWFHDVVYEGRPGQDEQASAARLAGFGAALAGEAGEGGAAETAQRAVETGARLILSTIDHAPRADAPEDALFLDADLEILAAEPARYAAYAAAVRREFQSVPDALFRSGRAAVLTRLLERPRLYLATPGWEAAARANLTRERAALTAEA